MIDFGKTSQGSWRIGNRRQRIGTDRPGKARQRPRLRSRRGSGTGRNHPAGLIPPSGNLHLMRFRLDLELAWLRDRRHFDQLDADWPAKRDSFGLQPVLNHFRQVNRHCRIARGSLGDCRQHRASGDQGLPATRLRQAWTAQRIQLHRDGDVFSGTKDRLENLDRLTSDDGLEKFRRQGCPAGHCNRAFGRDDFSSVSLVGPNRDALGLDHAKLAQRRRLQTAPGNRDLTGHHSGFSDRFGRDFSHGVLRSNPDVRTKRNFSRHRGCRLQRDRFG